MHINDAVLPSYLLDSDATELVFRILLRCKMAIYSLYAKHEPETWDTQGVTYSDSFWGRK